MNLRTGYIIAVSLLAGLLIQGVKGQQPYRLQGRILNEQNKPVPDATISFEGALIEPAISSEDGVFEIDVPEASGWLIIKPASGYKTIRIFVEGTDSMRILIPRLDIESPHDAILGIFGNQAGRDLVSSSRAIQSGRIHHIQNQTLEQSMQGIVSGLHSTGQSGERGHGT